jgi:D-cysteine desulfhydrase
MDLCQMNLNYPTRTKLAHLPTPIDDLERLSQLLSGPRIFMKRDDQTGLALGGNKTRKLEFLVADALSKGNDSLITTGAPQSNHCRQTAAAAARVGMDCHLVLRGEPVDKLNGNLLLDHLLGAHLHWSGDRDTAVVMDEVADEIQAAGRSAYQIPLGGSNSLGALGYVAGMQEALSQLEAKRLEIDAIVFASSSGGTQSGLVVGAHALSFSGRVLGISIEHPENILKEDILVTVSETAFLLELPDHSYEEAIEINDSYLGAGYGLMGEAEREAINLVASLEGILLDPVYTGRAMAGLIDLIRRGAFFSSQNILFWHTGGTPALFAYGDQLLV